MNKGKIAVLKDILDKSRYTVALCGSGMMEEGGFMGIKLQDRAYEIESKYGESPEYLFSSAYYQTRPERFFEFYKKEMLEYTPQSTVSSDVLAAMERAGKLQMIITANIYGMPERSGCHNVVNLHGTIYNNECSHCKKKFPVEAILQSKGIPHCDECGMIIRPMVALFGEQLDSRQVEKATLEIEKADVMLLLGTTLKSDVFTHYIRYFEGSKLVIIHNTPHHLDTQADLVIIDHPMNVLPLLGY